MRSPHPLPLYYRIARDLEKKIVTKELRPGDLIATELQLCEIYGVSRITVRTAMEDLIAKRLVVRQRGIGTFVAEASHANRLAINVASVHEAVSYAETVSFRRISRAKINAPVAVAAGLKLEEDSEVCKIVQLGLVDDGPIFLAEVYLPLDIAAKLPRGSTKTDGPVIKKVESTIGESMERVEQTISPAVAPAEMVEFLGLKSRTPVLQISRVYYMESGRPVEVAIVWYHPQRYEFKLQIVRAHGP